jgi:hypothetical protein
LGARTIDTYDQYALEYVRNSPRSVSGRVKSGFTDIDIQEKRNPGFPSGQKDWLHITARRPTA